MELPIKKHIALILAVMMTLVFIPTTSFAADSADTITYTPVAGEEFNFEEDDFANACEDVIGSSSSGDITYSGDADDEIDFNEEDFNDYCQDENDEDLDYITFSIPSSSEGVLWYDYDGDNKEKVTKYYYDDPSISDITFIPDDDFSGNVSIDFDGEDVEGDSIEGTVVISVDNDDTEAADIYLSGTVGTAVTMQDLYFSNRCYTALSDTLDYVKFTLPSSDGTLYYDYTADSSSTKRRE